MGISFLGSYMNIGVDLGSANTLICKSNGDITLSEPTVVAMDKVSKKVLAVGNDANEMLGRTPDNILAVCPVRNGVIADFEAASAMMRVFIRRANGKASAIKPRVAVSVPNGITEVERRAAVETFMAAGARSVLLVEEAMAAALGAGLPVEMPQGSMIVNIGAGTSEAAVISLGGIVSGRSVRVGGNHMDNAIISYMRRKYGITIGAKTAEEIKIEIGSVNTATAGSVYDVKGRETSSGLPKNIRIKAEEINDTVGGIIDTIVTMVLETLEDTPPELAADVLSAGILLSGGGAGIKGIDEVIEKATGIKTRIADNPTECVCKGAGAALLNNAVIRRSEIMRKR